VAAEEEELLLVVVLVVVEAGEPSTSHEREYGDEGVLLNGRQDNEQLEEKIHTL
jgi:hypothetical protein